MATDTPINAHQQRSVPLLRRPRAPKPIKVASTNSKKTSPQTNYHLVDEEKLESRDLGSIELEETDATSNFVIHSLYPLGPAFFPPGKVIHSYNTVAVLDQLPPEADIFDEFEVDDDLVAWMPPKPLLRSSKSGVMLSQQNYKKLTGWFAIHVPKQDTLNTVQFSLDAVTPPTRKPLPQAIIEFRALLDEVLCGTSSLLLDQSLKEGEGEGEGDRWPTPTPNDTLFRSTTTKFFCGQGRCDSPFDSSHQPLIDPSEVAVIESMLNGGRKLNFKAHFICQLPDLFPLAHTLTHLNLSFNNFTVFPSEVLKLHELLCLQMRNNPLKELPNGIHSLSKLKILCVSFSLLSDLPPGLFELSHLVDLDVSYNSLHCLSRDMEKLTSLRKLNVEGNQLSGLPYPVASLSLRQLLSGDNLMHPLLWRENTRNQPQTLLDLCCVQVHKLRPQQTASNATTNQCLNRRKNGSCDQCGGVVYGAGLRVIRSIQHSLFNVKNLPFIFVVCGPSCSRELRNRENFDLVACADHKK